jgi:hypothetical protein
MCYGGNGTVKFFEPLADNVFRHNYSMIKTNSNDITEVLLKMALNIITLNSNTDSDDLRV